MITLKVKYPDNRSEEYNVHENNMIIGRGEDVDIRITVPTISRKHAQLEKVGPNT